MAPSRLNDSHKQEIVERYRAGDTSVQIAAAYGCSTNTVSRTVRSLLSPEEYAELKAQRSTKSSGLEGSVPEIDTAEVSGIERIDTSLEDSRTETPSAKGEGGDETADIAGNSDGQRSLALDDAGDFGGADLDDKETFNTDDQNVFHEIAVLPVDLPQVTTQQVICRPFASELLPDSVYMLVDKTVELDPRPLSEFPELGLSDPSEQQRQALCLYASPRAARRQCGRSQRVIKVPDTQVFEKTSSYLLARGITHLVVEGSLFALKC
jgi:transposase-like protein